MYSLILIIISYLIIFNLISIKSISYSLSESLKLNNTKIFNDLNLNITNEEFFQKKIFLPEYQNKFSRINELNDTNFNFGRIRNNRSVALVPKDLIEINEKQLDIEKITDIINSLRKKNINANNEYNTQDEVYSDDYSFYSDSISFYHDLEIFYHKYIKLNTLIYERGSSSIRDIVTTNPLNLFIKNEICKPKLILFRIVNPNLEESLLIKRIRTDLYQLKIFPYIKDIDYGKKGIEQNDFMNLTPELNSDLGYSIPPISSYVFQILILIDQIATIKGTLYIEFNEKKVLLVPILLIGKDNSHKINPIYYLNYQVKKFFYSAVELYNPTKNVLSIKEIIHSFEKIKIIWPNGEPYKTNKSIEKSMLKIEPFSSKKIFYLKLYSTRPENIYGFIQFRTDNNDANNLIMVPVLINLVNSPIIPYPRLLNFGLCDITPKSRNNFIKMIPLDILNDGLDYIKLGKVYIDYDELFLQFHQNFGGENIVLKPGESVKYGYVIFNGNLEKNFENSLINKKAYFGKILKKSLYIETNYTDTPLVEIEYSYMLSKNNDLLAIKGNIQTLPKNKEKFSFLVNIKLKKPIKLKIYNNMIPGINMTLYNDKFVLAKILNPMNDYLVYESNITIEIKKISKWENKHYYFIPIELNNKLFILMPLQIDNDELKAIYCGNEENSTSLSICLKNLKPENQINNINGVVYSSKIFHINFGNSSEGIKKQKFIYIINENELPIVIKSINIEKNEENILIDYEGYEYFGNGESPEKKVIIKRIKNLKYKNLIYIKIYQYIAVKISISLIANNLTTNQKVINSLISLSYGESHKFVLSLNAMIFKGNMNLSPVIYKFEPSFPGLLQTTTIFAKSSFNIPVDIVSLTSSDERIIPKLLVNKAYPENKTPLIEVKFDPTKSYLINEDLNSFELDMSNTLTYKELFLWKAKEKFFNKLGSTGRTEINANVTIATMLDKGDINFKSFLIRPNLSKNSIINYGVCQIGKPTKKYFEIINPSDKMITLKLILAEDEFSDVSKNFMFNIKDKNLLEKNNDLIIFGCNFILFLNGKNILKYELIVVPEKIDPIDLRKGTFNKKNLILILYKYGNDKVKTYLYNAKSVLCKYDRKTQNEILFNNNSKNNYLISQIYSEEFNNEISNIKKMTYKKIEEEVEYHFIEKKSMFNSIISYFFNLYLKYFLNMSINSNIKIIENTQSFFIPMNIQDNIYQIPPHKKVALGPIIFKPNTSGPIKATLFVKNNLTILYPIKLSGSGGSGIIKFINYYTGLDKKKNKLLDENNFIVEIDEDIYENEIKGKGKLIRTIKIMNGGNIKMIIRNITIDNTNKCQTDNLKVTQCQEFKIKPKETKYINIEIIPNYRSLATNKIIYFNTEYQSFYLNVFIIISKDLYESKNYIYIYLKCFIIVLFIVAIMLFLLYKIINVIQKHRREICANESEKKIIETEKEEKKENLLKNQNEINNNENDLGYNNNNINNNLNQNKNKQKQKKRKNRKKSNSSNQKDEVETSKNNNEKKENEKAIEDDEINKNKEEKNINENNKPTKEEQTNEIDNIKNNNQNDSNKKIDSEYSNKEIKTENKIPSLGIPKPKKRNFKGSIDILNNKNKTNENDIKKNDYEKQILSDRIQIKRDLNKGDLSEDNKDKKVKDKKKPSVEQRLKSNENKNFNNKNNEIEYGIEAQNYDTNNYNYNYYTSNKNPYQYKNKKPRRDQIKKYYPSNRKYYYYDNNLYSSSTTYNNYNAYNQQPKKQITKIKKEKNAKNLKELFEIEQQPKRESKEVIKEKKETENIVLNNKNMNNTSNNNINNISNIKLSNDELIEEDITEELFGIKKQKEIFDYKYPIAKKLSEGTSDKNEEMNPTFLNDIKTNNAFDAEQELIKSLKKENKEVSNKSNNGEVSKEEFDMDLSNNSHFNFDYYFFEPQQQDNDEPEYKGDYEDFKFKSLIDNLNNENPFSNEEQKGKLDLLLSSNNISNKEESEDKKDINENEDIFKDNDYEQFVLTKNKFDNYNIFDYEVNNNDNKNFEEKKFQNKFDEYHKKLLENFGKNK